MLTNPKMAECGVEGCNWEMACSSLEEATRRLSVHLNHRHAFAPLEGVKQLDNVSWQDAFLDAVRSVPLGKQLTTADLHELVPPPPHHNAWGSATSRAAHLGLIREVDRRESTLASTKRSLVRVWERVDNERRQTA